MNLRPRALELTIYTRQDCCLCDAMKETVRKVAGDTHSLQEIDVDTVPELRAQFGEEVPVLCINGRKAFKFRLSERELRAKMKEYLRRL